MKLIWSVGTEVSKHNPLNKETRKITSANGCRARPPPIRLAMTCGLSHQYVSFLTAVGCRRSNSCSCQHNSTKPRVWQITTACNWIDGANLYIQGFKQHYNTLLLTTADRCLSRPLSIGLACSGWSSHQNVSPLTAVGGGGSKGGSCQHHSTKAGVLKVATINNCTKKTSSD